MLQSFPPLSPLLLPNSGHRLVDNYHDMYLGPIALSSETYFISQQENKDTGGGGDGAQYFIGLHFDEIASGCPMNFGLAAPRERTTACRRCTRNFFNTYFSSSKIHISLFSFCTFLGFRSPYFSLSFGRIFLCFRDFYAFHSSCTDYDLHDLRGRLELNQPSLQSSRSLQSFPLSLSTLSSSCGLSLRIFFQFLERLGIVRQSWKE